AALERLQRAQDRPFLAREVAIEALRAHARQRGAQRLEHALGAVAGQAQVLAVARRAALRSGRAEAAVVALHVPAALVNGQHHRAVAAQQLAAAFAAQQQRGIAAPVEQQQRLLASQQTLLQRLEQRRRQDRIAALPQHLAPVDDLDLRQRARADALGQPQQPVLAGEAVRVRLERRRRRAEHGQRSFELRAIHGHVARVVARALFLLVGRLVLLV